MINRRECLSVLTTLAIGGYVASGSEIHMNFLRSRFASEVANQMLNDCLSGDCGDFVECDYRAYSIYCTKWSHENYMNKLCVCVAYAKNKESLGMGRGLVEARFCEHFVKNEQDEDKLRKSICLEFEKLISNQADFRVAQIWDDSTEIHLSTIGIANVTSEGNKFEN